MMHLRYFDILLYSMLTAAGCNESGTKTPPAAQEHATAHAEPAPASAPTPAAARDTHAASVRESVGIALAEYESIRAALAKDSVAGIAASAQKVADAATKAGQHAEAKQRPHLEGVATAAKALEEKAKGDIAEVRKQFGQLSQHLVGLISADPSLGKGLHVFECPMAEGYKKWIQPSAKIENPYMGKKMPQCGSESQWS
jgi:hypothetical protein